MASLPPTFVKDFHDEVAVRSMPYNDLGKTGLKVSHIGLGGGCFSQLYGNFEENDAILTVQEGLKKGINYIDTAPWYGQGRSEEVLGKALKNVPRGAYYIATKVGRYELDPSKMFDFSAAKTLESVEKSLGLLGLDYVDIIQVHDIEFAPSLDIIVKETLPTLREIVKSGKARFIGITGYSLSVLKKLVELSEEVTIDTVLTYSRDTLIDDSLHMYLPFFQDRNVGIICAAGPAMGLLTNAGPQSWHPASQELKDLCKKASEYCKSTGVELGRLAMHHALTRKGQSTHVVGMNTRTLLKSNLQLVFEGISSDEESVLKELNQRFFTGKIQGHWEGVELSGGDERLSSFSK